MDTVAPWASLTRTGRVRLSYNNVRPPRPGNDGPCIVPYRTKGNETLVARPGLSIDLKLAKSPT